jgi:hypothetical protein
MPNKGNPRYVVRFEPRLLELMLDEIDSTNARRKGLPFKVAQWIRQACIDKLKHSARSRRADLAELAELAELDAFPETGV